MSANVVGKIVYLAGPRGPEQFTLEGVWIHPISNIAPGKRHRRTRAEMRADVENGVDVENGDANGNGVEVSDSTEPVFTDRTKRMGRPVGSKNKPKNGAARSHKRGGGQGSI